MAHEMEDFLRAEIGVQEERMRAMAAKLEELAEIDCPLGVCVYDPGLQALGDKLDEIQHRKEVIEDTLRTISHRPP